MKKVLTVSGIILFFVLIYQLSKDKTPTTPRSAKLPNNDNNNTDGGNSGTGGTGSGGGTGGGGSGGTDTGVVEIFQYYGDDTGEDVDFSSHSIVSKSVSNIGVDAGVANSFCEYWVYDANNVLKVYCKNTRSGLHPNYGNSFNHNNHFPQYSKKLAAGTYKLVYKNISVDAGVKQHLIYGLVAYGASEQINADILSGETREFMFDIYDSMNSHFKMNNNVLE